MRPKERYAIVVVVDGVGEEVGEDLREAVGVAVAGVGGEVGCDAEATFVGEWSHQFESVSASQYGRW